jgi:hypothetical protein
VVAFSSHASICGDIFISWGPRFSRYGGKVNLSRCLYSPAIRTLGVNPQKKEKKEEEGAKKMQKVMLIGNLGRDPEVKYSQEGIA